MAEISIKDVLDKYIELMESQAKTDKDIAVQLASIKTMLAECKSDLKSNTIKIIYTLILALCAVVGIKLILPS